MAGETRARLFGPIGMAILVAAVMAGLLYLWQAETKAPPAAQTGFSSADARALQERLLAEKVPHIAGSPANAVVRDRILAEFRAAGYAPEVHSSFACTTFRDPGCTTVDNIIAIRKGAGDGEAILATAHYDSVAAGPGAGDDGAGVVVILELARHLASLPPARNDVIFLISDGEETGLRGADAFADHDPLMKRVGLVVNVEARGAAGPSIMFETGANNAALIALFQKTIAHPVSNSLAYEVYKLLPNDTDFSVYKKYGLSGYNFGIVGSASLYHSQRDDPDHLNAGSLQHHGDNVFALVRALQNIDLATLSSDHDASYFDVFGRMLVAWPAGLNLPIALGALAAIFLLAVVHFRAFSFGGIFWSLLGLVAVPIIYAGLGWLLSFPLGIWPGVHPLDHPEPWPARIALVGAAMLGALIAGVDGREAGLRASALINWLAFAGLAVADAKYVPGSAYALIWPAVVFAAVGWAETLTRGRAPGMLSLASFFGFVAAAFFWLAHMLALETVFSFSAGVMKMLVLVPLGLALAPVFAASMLNPERRGWPAIVLLAIGVGGAAYVAMNATTYTPDRPRGVDIVYYDDRTAGAAPRWQINTFGPPDEAYLKAAGFSAIATPYKRFGIFPAKGHFKPAGDLHLPPPTFTPTEVATRNGLIVLSGILHAGRGGALVGLGAPEGSGLMSVRAENQDVLTAEALKAAPVTATFVGLAARDASVEFTFDPAKPAAVILVEQSALPDDAEARRLQSLRPANAAPAHSGDTATVLVSLDLAKLAQRR
jgi:hypothetical protein